MNCFKPVSYTHLLLKDDAASKYVVSEVFADVLDGKTQLGLDNETIASNAHARITDLAGFSMTFFIFNVQMCIRDRSNTWDLGFDIGLFNNRISAVVDLYQTKTTAILLPRTLPTSMGGSNATPVSYTHLDVYKRQTYIFNRIRINGQIIHRILCIGQH